MGIKLIVACNKDFAIGSSSDNTLLYHIKEDLQRFKSLTTGHYVVMGSVTFESLKKPLPNRTNVIVTRNKNLNVPSEFMDNYDILIENDLVRILNQYKFTGNQDKDLWIIGGSQIYAEAIHWCDEIYMTMIDDCNHPKADVYFNQQELSEFKLVSREKKRDEVLGLNYSFLNYERK